MGWKHSAKNGFEKMKIGIVTFFCVPNYGAMLQAHVLWHVLAKRGHEVEFIDYSVCKANAPSLLHCFMTRHMSAIRHRLKSFVRYPMTDFASSCPRTRHYVSYDDLKSNCPKYDCLIVGSDQMWNPMWFSDEKLPFVMLDFANESCRRLACSVSFGTDKWRKDQNAILAGELIGRFLAISVREESGVALVEKLSGRRDAQCLIDPTMLFGADAYLALCRNAPEVSGDYVFEYFLDDWLGADEGRSVVKKVMAALNISKVKSDRIPVAGALAPLCRMMGITSKRRVEDWLACLSNASFVCTNSFHGTVFSLLFHRPFVTILLKGQMAGMNERVLSLLDKVGLRSRAVCVDEIARIDGVLRAPIDWETVDRRFDGERVKFNRFISEAGL